MTKLNNKSLPIDYNYFWNEIVYDKVWDEIAIVLIIKDLEKKIQSNADKIKNMEVWAKNHCNMLNNRCYNL